jgi:hypothetical protein
MSNAKREKRLHTQWPDKAMALDALSRAAFLEFAVALYSCSSSSSTTERRRWAV